MTAQSFTYSGNVYTGATAGTIDFALTSTAGNPILYLENAHIHVYKSVNQGTSWTELSRPASWDFVNSGTVARLTTGTTAGDWIKVQRITPSTSSYVTFQASSLLTAEQLNDDTLFNTYLNQERFDQGEQSSLVATNAETAANAATSAATAATSAANTATSTANSALSSATAAVSTANAASSASTAATATANQAASDAAAAVSTANTASSNASTALSTANTASTNASNAVTTANTASSNASAALSTANTAASNASTALSTANTAASNASTALSTANTASTNASAAVSTANSASTTASAAAATATSADSKADQAISAVANAILFDLVANVAAIPPTPANNDAVEVFDSTGIESFTPLTGLPGGFVGSSGLSVRMVYSSTGSTWNWIQYFPNDPETRYLKFSGGTLTGQLRGDDSTSASTPGFAFDGDPDTGLGRPGPNELALITGGVARLTFDSAGAASFTNSVTIPAGSTVTGYLTTGDAASTYLTQANAASTYQTQAGMSSYLTTSSAGSTYAPLASPTFTGTVTIPAGASIDGYLTTADAGSTYLTQANAASTYQTQAGMSSYLTTSTASSTYAPLASPTFTGTVTIPAGASISGYLTTASASSTYQTQAGMSSYLTTASASSTYAPQASPTFTGAPYVNGSYRGNIVSMGGTVIDCSLGNFFTVTLGGSVSFTVSNAPSSRSYAFTLEVVHTTGTITWFSGVVWPNGTAPTLTTGKTHLFMFHTDNGGATWRGSSLINYNS